MLASSLFFGRSIRERREREKALYESGARDRSAQSPSRRYIVSNMTPAYLEYSKRFFSTFFSDTASFHGMTRERAVELMDYLQRSYVSMFPGASHFRPTGRKRVTRYVADGVVVVR